MGTKKSGRGCSNPTTFTMLLGASVFIYFGAIGPYSSGILTTMQREFQLKSSEIAIISSINDIVGLIVITPVAYLGGPRHRPRILAFLSFVFALGCICSALPQFTGNTSHGAPAANQVDSVVLANETDNGNMSNPYTNFMSQPNLCEVDDENGMPSGSHGDNKTGDDAGGEDECSAEELEASGAQFGRAAWIAVGQVFIGIGSSGFFTLGLSYMDDGMTSKSKSALHIAALFMLVSISPIVGFAISAMCLSYHTDFYKINVDELGYDDKDPRWIGAWWLGYIIFAVITALLSFPYLLFPREWPKKKEDVIEVDEKRGIDYEKDDEQPSTAFLMKQALPPGASCGSLIKGYFLTLKRLITNATYMSVVIGSMADSAMFAGCFTFLGRYLQSQYDVPPAMTSIYLGASTSPGSFLGNFIAGILMRKLHLSMKGTSRLIVCLSGFTIFVALSFFFTGCETSAIAGLNTPYPGMDSIEDIPLCHGGCDCPIGVYQPVCGADGLTYITPCHAGCTESYQEDNGQIIYADCPCVGTTTNTTTAESFAPQFASSLIALSEKCPAPCAWKKYIFIVFLSLLLFMYSIVSVPGYMLFLRSVGDIDKAVGLAFSSFLGRVLAYIPAPIYFGAAIQTTCLLYQESCGKTGNCFVYDNKRFTLALFGLTFAFKVLALIMNIVTYFTIQKNEDGEYASTQVCGWDSGSAASDGEEADIYIRRTKGLTREDSKAPMLPYETTV